MEEEREQKSFADLDALADLHERMSRQETASTLLSRRVTVLETRSRGKYSDDPMDDIPWGLLIGGLVIIQLLPLIIDMVKQCRSSSSSV